MICQNAKSVNGDSVFRGQHGEKKDEEVIDKILGPQQVMTSQAAARDQIGITWQDLSRKAHGTVVSNRYATIESK
jgi:hypothetical protein